MEHYPLGNGDLESVSMSSNIYTGYAVLTILSWVSLRAESFASTASSVYDILIADSVRFGRQTMAKGNCSLQLYEGVCLFVDGCGLLLLRLAMSKGLGSK